MTFRVLFRPEAEAELIETMKWYDTRRPGLGGAFVEAVAHVVSGIIANPFAYPIVFGETRRAVLSRFPYALYFRILGGEAVVLAVHGRQHPSRWQRRL